MWRSLDTLLFVQRGCMPSFVCKVDFAQMLCNGFPFWQKVTTLLTGKTDLCSLSDLRRFVLPLYFRHGANLSVLGAVRPGRQRLGPRARAGGGGQAPVPSKPAILRHPPALLQCRRLPNAGRVAGRVLRAQVEARVAPLLERARTLGEQR
jgi:hypothetical protein